MQHAQSEQSDDDCSLTDNDSGWYTLVRGLSFASAYEAARLEQMQLEDNDLPDSDQSSDPDDSTAASTTDTTESDSEDEGESERFAFRIADITHHHQEEIAVLEECAARLSVRTSTRAMPPTNTRAKPIERGPIVRAWTKKMDHVHARERQIA